MSYPEKRTLATLSTMALLFAIYCIYAFTRIQIQDPLRTWAITMLIFSGIAIIVMVIVQILFHVLLSVEIAVKEAVTDPDVADKKIGQTIKNEFIEDERDKMLAHKSMQVGYIIRGGVDRRVNLPCPECPACCDAEHHLRCHLFRVCH